jgi:hypothetical protein
LKRFAATKIPFIGRRLANTTFAYKDTVAKQAKDEAIKAINNEDIEGFRRAIEKDPYLNDKEVIQRMIADITDEEMDKKDKANWRKEMNKKYNPFFTK